MNTIMTRNYQVSSRNCILKTGRFFWENRLR